MTHGLLTTWDVAKMMGVYHTTVARWIDSGKLKGLVTPGGHRRVKKGDLIDFFRDRDQPVPEGLLERNKIKVLIVDNEIDVLNVLVGAFRRFDEFEILTSMDGFDAGCQAVEHRPDVIILDIFLPGVNGFEVCRKAKEKCGVVKVIAITGFDSEETRQDMMDAGADAYFVKPVDFDELVGTAREMFEKVVTYRAG